MIKNIELKITIQEYDNLGELSPELEKLSERAKHISVQATINSADEYLYKAKKEGRNQVAYKK